MSKPVQQAAKGFVVAATALPIDRLTGIAIVSLPNPDFVALALKEMPHLVQFDHDGLARLRLGTIVVKVAADPAQDGLRGRPKKSGNSPERQSMTIETDRDTLDVIRRAGGGRPGKLIAARSTPPPLLAQNMTGFHNAMATASRTRRMLLHHSSQTKRNNPILYGIGLYGIGRYPVTPSLVSH